MHVCLYIQSNNDIVHAIIVNDKKLTSHFLLTSKDHQKVILSKIIIN